MRNRNLLKKKLKSEKRKRKLRKKK